MEGMRVLFPWRLSRRSPANLVGHAPLRPMRWWPAAALGVVFRRGWWRYRHGIAGCVGTGAASVVDPNAYQLDRVKVGLTVSAGLAAGVTLLITLRRQTLSERTQWFTEADAIERRITDLYVAATDQLGSEKSRPYA